MEESPFSKKPVDGIKERSVIGLSGSLKKPLNNNHLVAKILGIGLSCVLAFSIYSLYSEYTDEEALESYDNTPQVSEKITDISIPDISLPSKSIGVEVSNSKVDESLRIKSTKIAPYTEVKFNITKPDGGLYQFSATAKITGYISTELDESILTEVGEYKIEALADGYESFGEKNFFLRVGAVSIDKSSIYTDKYTVDVTDEVEVVATLVDKYDNPIVDADVSLISTRQINDTIEYSNTRKTDENGEIYFLVKTDEPGESSYLLLDKASGRSLDKKVDVLFKEQVQVDEGELEGDAGSSVSWIEYFIPTALAYSDIAYYTIEGSSTFTVGQEAFLDIKAYDNTNSLVQDYTGQINITSEPVIDSLTNTYTFTEEDSGHYSLPINISTIGPYLITITSSGNASVKGEKNLTVEEATNEGGSELSPPQILSPSQGGQSDTIMNISKINIAGKSAENMTVEIYDGDIKLGETISSDRGLFFFQTEVLVDGRHNFKAVLIDSDGFTVDSEIVSIIIDTTNPAITERSVTIDPTQVLPGDSITITVKAEPSLASAKAIVNKTVIILLEDVTKAGVYVGTYKASNIAGIYDVDIELKDSISNPVMFKKQGTVTVTKTPVVTPPTPTPTPIPTPTPTPEPTPDTGPAELFLAIFAISVISVFLFKPKAVK